MSEGKRSLFSYGETWMVCTALSYSLGNIFDRVAMRGIKPDPFLGAIMKALPHVALALIFIFLALDKKQFGAKADTAETKAYRYFVYSGFVSAFIGQWSFLTAIRLGGINVAVPTIQVWTLIAALIGVVWLKEKFHINIFVGLVFAIVGLLVLCLGQYRGMPVSPHWYLGVPYGLLTACCYAFSTAFFTKGQKLGASRFKGIATAYTSGIIFLLIYMLVTGRMNVFSVTPSKFYYMILIAGILASMATIFMYTAVRLAPMSKVIPINTCYPALTAIIAGLFLGEKLNVFIMGGIILIIVGVTISQRTRALMAEEAESKRKAADAARA
jgi:bacterial/archaeal transporter family protein